jgi:hypothetical protein
MFTVNMMTFINKLNLKCLELFLRFFVKFRRNDRTRYEVFFLRLTEGLYIIYNSKYIFIYDVKLHLKYGLCSFALLILLDIERSSQLDM